MNALDQVTSPMYIVPAYGRKYKTADDAIAAWEAGKDFKVVRGPYCSIRDIDKMQCSSLWIDLVTEVVRIK